MILVRCCVCGVTFEMDLPPEWKGGDIKTPCACEAPERDVQLDRGEAEDAEEWGS